MAKHADLIYDVGFHQGEDTAFYLKRAFVWSPSKRTRGWLRRAV